VTWTSLTALLRLSSGPRETEDNQCEGETQAEQHTDRERPGEPGPAADQPPDAAVEDHPPDQVAHDRPAGALLRAFREVVVLAAGTRAGPAHRGRPQPCPWAGPRRPCLCCPPRVTVLHPVRRTVPAAAWTRPSGPRCRRGRRRARSGRSFWG